MSSVDNRVVEMQFNNAQFEKGISQTTNSLNNLKKSLNLEDAVNTFSKINGAAGRVNLTPMEQAAMQVQKRFSVLGIVSATAISNITNRVMDFGFKIKHLALDSLIHGGLTRALNIEQAKFQIEGLHGVWDETSKGYVKGMKTIKEATNEAVKGTAYGLDEAAKVGSQLLASGIKDADELSVHMRAVAGVAAMTSASYGEIGRIFTQTAGQGAMMGHQLQELSARGLNAAATITEYFKKHKDAWKEATEFLSDKQMEKLGGAKKPTEKAVRELASMRRIDFKTFSAAMDEAFGEHAKDANKTFTGAMSNMKAALARLGAEFQSPRLENLRKVFNALTPVIDDVHEKLKPMIGQLNEVHSLYTGKFVKLLEALHKGIAPKGEDESEKAYQKRIKSFAGDFGKLSDILGGVVSSFRILKRVFGTIGEALKPVGNGFLSILASIGRYITGIDKATEKSKLFTNVASILSSIGAIIGNVFEGIGEGVGYIADGLGRAAQYISNAFSKIAIDSEKVLAIFSTAGIVGIYNQLQTFVKGFNKTPKLLGKIFNDLAKSFKTNVAPVKKALTSIHDAFVIFQSGLKSTIILNLAKALGIMAGSLFLLSTVPYDKLMGGVGGLAAVAFIFERFINSLTGFIGSKTSILKLGELVGVGAALNAIAVAIILMSSSVRILATLSWEEIGRGLLALASILSMITLSIRALSKQRPDKLTKGIASIVFIAQAVKMLAKATKEFSTMSWEELKKGLSSVIGLLGVMTLLTRLSGKGFNIRSAAAFIALAEAIKILEKPVLTFSKIDTASLVKGIGGVIVVMGALAGITKMMSKGLGALTGAAGFYILANALTVIADAVSSFSSMSGDMESLAKGIGALLVTLGGLTLIGHAAKGMLSGAVAIRVLAGGVKVLADSLAILAKIPAEMLAKSIIALAGGILLLGAVMAVLGNFTPLIMSFASAMLVSGIGMAAWGAGILALATGVGTLVSIAAGGMSVIKELIKVLMESIPALGLAVGGFIVNLVSALTAHLTEIVNFGAQLIVALLKGLSEKLPLIIAYGSKIIIGLLSGISAHIYQIATIAIDILTKFIDAIANRMDSIVDTGMNLIAKFVNGMANGLREHGPELIAAFKNLWGAIMEFAVTILQEIVELIPGIGPGLASALEGVKAEIRKATAPEDMKKMSEEQIKAYGSGMDAGKQEVIKGAKKVTGVAKKHIGSKSSFDRAGRSDTSAYAGGIGSGKGVDKAARRLKKSAVNGVSGSKEFGTQGDKGGSAYGGGIGKHDKKAAAEAKKLKSKATTSISGTAKDFSKEGDNAGSGFVAGLKAWISRAFSAGKSVTSSGVKGAKAGQNSHSPSKKMMEQGKFFVMGYVLGIRRYENKAIKEGKSLTASTVDTVKDSLKAAHSILESGIDVNPTIRPVMDTSDIERGASYIDNILGKNTAYSASVFSSIDDGANAKDRKILGLTEGFDNLSKRLNQVTDTMNNRELNAYITVNGSENPEDFADRFLRQMKLNMRA